MLHPGWAGYPVKNRRCITVRDERYRQAIQHPRPLLSGRFIAVPGSSEAPARLARIASPASASGPPALNRWPQRVGSLSLISPDRAEFDDAVSKRDLQRLAREHPDLSAIQTSRAASPRSWGLSQDKHLLTQRPDVAFRAYGYYTQSLDLSLVRSLPHARHFHVDVHDAHHVECLGNSKGLKGWGWPCSTRPTSTSWHLCRHRLTSLSIGATRSKKPDLAVLDRFRDLKTLFIEGQSKNINVLAGLRTLENVTLKERHHPATSTTWLPTRHCGRWISSWVGWVPARGHRWQDLLETSRALAEFEASPLSTPSARSPDFSRCFSSRYPTSTRCLTSRPTNT